MFVVCVAMADSIEIRIENPDHVSRGIRRAELDGVVLPDGQARFTLVKDAGTHDVRVVLG